MASIGTLWTTPKQFKGKTVSSVQSELPVSVYRDTFPGTQIRAAAALGGLRIDLPDNYVHYQDNKKPEFLAKFPHGKIPAFEGANGFKLFEASAIARYSKLLATHARSKTRPPLDLNSRLARPQL